VSSVLFRFSKPQNFCCFVDTKIENPASKYQVFRKKIEKLMICKQRGFSALNLQTSYHLAPAIFTSCKKGKEKLPKRKKTPHTDAQKLTSEQFELVGVNFFT
jgi:hypothetical protein